MKTKNLFTALLLTIVVGEGFSQCLEINCPADTAFQAATDECEAVYDYDAPIGVDICVMIKDTFDFTGAKQSYIVPDYVDTLYVELYGAQGNSNAGGVAGGFGGYAEGKIPVSAGEELFIYVGGGGNLDQYGGFNGGGDAGVAPTLAAIAGGGGGASDIRIGGDSLVDRIIVAAGGAGAGGNRISGGSRGTGGGGGGGLYGGGGGAGWPIVGSMARGGTQSAGGAGGVSSDDPMYDGEDGILGVGGNGGGQGSAFQASTTTNIQGVNGGGLIGEDGHSAGDWTGGSGAGGSSYIDGVVDGNTQSGLQSGPGKVILKWYGEPVATTMISGLSSGSIFPSGTTTNTYEVSDGANSKTCSFNVTVLPNIDTTVNVNQATLEAQNSTANYQWLDCSTNDVIANETNQLFQPEENGSYAVIIDQGGCIDTSSCHQISTVGLDQNIIGAFNIYPNPTSSKVTIDLGEKALSGTVLIYSVNGETVFNKSFENNNSIDLSIPGSTGVYFIQIYGNNYHYTERIIKR